MLFQLHCEARANILADQACESRAEATAVRHPSSLVPSACATTVSLGAVGTNFEFEVWHISTMRTFTGCASGNRGLPPEHQLLYEGAGSNIASGCKSTSYIFRVVSWM